MQTSNMVVQNAPTIIGVIRCLTAAWLVLVADQLLRLALRAVPEGHPVKVLGTVVYDEHSKRRRCVADALRVR